MVKGTTRRVIVIKSPEPEIFDQAIFFVKEDALSKGVSQAEILKQARNIADDYIKNHSERRFHFKMTPAVYAVLGGIGASILWLISIFVF